MKDKRVFEVDQRGVVTVKKVEKTKEEKINDIREEKEEFIKKVKNKSWFNDLLGKFEITEEQWIEQMVKVKSKGGALTIEESEFKQGMVCKITEIGKEDVYYELEKFLIGKTIKLQEDALETEDGYFMGEVEILEGFDTGEENMGIFEKGESITFCRVKFEKI